MNHSKTSYTYLNTASTLETTTTTTTTTTTLSESNNNNLDLDDQEIIMDTPLSPESSNNNYFFDFQNSFSMEQDSSEEMKDIEDTTTTTTALSNNNNINAYDSDVEDGEIFEDPETIIDTPLSPENSNNNNINNNNFVAPHLPPIFNTGNPGLFTISDDSFGFGYDQLWKQEPLTFDQMLVNTEVYNVLKKKAEKMIELEKKLEKEINYYPILINLIELHLKEAKDNLKKISAKKPSTKKSGLESELEKQVELFTRDLIDLKKYRGKKLDELAQLKGQATNCNLTELNEYFNSLGSIWLENNKKYFADTPGSQECCRVFLTAAFQDETVLQAIFDNTAGKTKTNNLNIVFPKNISFVLARINGKTTCFVAPVRAKQAIHDQELINVLDKFASRFNTENKPEMFFSVIKDVSKKYHARIEFLTRKFFGDYMDRNCSEYHLGAQIAKLYFEYGENIQILGVTNTDLYPFKEGVAYGRDARFGTPESKIQAPRLDPSATLRDDAGLGLIFHTKPCCNACQKNQFAMLAILAAIDGYKKQFIASEKIENPFSPILARITKGTSTYQAFQALQSNHFFAPKDKKSLDGDTEGTKETKRVKRRNDDQGCRAESDATSNNNNVEEADNNTKRVKVTVK